MGAVYRIYRFALTTLPIAKDLQSDQKPQKTNDMFGVNVVPNMYTEGVANQPLTDLLKKSWAKSTSYRRPSLVAVVDAIWPYVMSDVTIAIIQAGVSYKQFT